MLSALMFFITFYRRYSHNTDMHESACDIANKYQLIVNLSVAVQTLLVALFGYCKRWGRGVYLFQKGFHESLLRIFWFQNSTC